MEHERIFAGQLLQSGGSLLHETVLEPRHFHDPTAKRVFIAVQRVVESGHDADIINVRDVDRELKASELSELLTMAPTIANWAYYQGQILQGYKLRALRSAAERMLHASDPDAAIEDAESTLDEVQRERASDRVFRLSEVVHDYIEEIQRRYYSGGELDGVTTGYSALNNYLYGWGKSKYYVVGGRPSHGKSGLLLNFAAAASIRNGHSVGFISLESSRQEIMKRLVANEGNIPSQTLATGLLHASDFDKLTDVAGRIYGAAFYCYDVPNQNIAKVASVCRKLVRQHGVEAIFVDYLQLIRVSEARDRREQTEQASLRLKDLARDLDVPVIVAAQLQRDVDGKRPTLGNIQHSSQVEQDADAAILLNPTEDIGEHTQNVEAIVAKHRDGETGVASLVFSQQYLRFAEEDNRYAETA